jgi:DNA-binding transcriptional LysR family regulator
VDWNDMKYVLAVSRHGTLSGAGRVLRVDATTVGRRIIAIEQALGARLFDRTPDGFRPTEAGRIAAEKAEEIEEATLAVSARVAGADSRVEGPVRISALDGMLNALVIPALPRLLARHPGLEITAVSGLETVRLSRREADIALRTHSPSEPDAVARRIGRCADALYCAAGFELGPDPPIIALAREHDHLGFSQHMARLLPGSPIAFRTNSEGQMHAAVRAGLGVGVLDCAIGDADMALRRYRPDPIGTRDLLAVTHVDMRGAPRVRAVVEFLSEMCAENADLMLGQRPLP